MTAREPAAAAALPTQPPPDKHSPSMNLSGAGLVSVWLLSIAAHLLLLTVMFALVFPYGAEEEDSDLPVARTEIVGSLDAASFTPSSEPELSEARVVTEPTELRFTPKAAPSPVEVLPSPEPDLSLVGIGGGGGDLSELGLSIGKSSGPEFFGLGGSAREAKRIVYVVDRSGSMLDTFVYVRQELKRSVGGLRRSQKFHVIFFNEGPPLESPPRDLVSAIGGRKEAFFEFLKSVGPSGGTEPEAAVRRALSLRPDLVYLLSDGIDFDPSLLDRLTLWNKDVNARFYTIAYIDQAGRRILEAIARQTNGDFTFVSEYDLP